MVYPGGRMKVNIFVRPLRGEICARLSRSEEAVRVIMLSALACSLLVDQSCKCCTRSAGSSDIHPPVQLIFRLSQDDGSWTRHLSAGRNEKFTCDVAYGTQPSPYL